MRELPVSFEIVILLFRNEQRKVIRRKVSDLYLSTYLDVGYGMASEEIASGWKIYSIQLEHFSIEKAEFQFA
jgi:hypothetical protein